MKIYVASALTHASKELKDQVSKLKDLLKANNFEVLDFYGLGPGTPEDIVRYDLGECVRKCDLLLAVCDEPALGVGGEILDALHTNKQVLVVAQKDVVITRGILGLGAYWPTLFNVKYYNNSLASEISSFVLDSYKRNSFSTSQD